MAIEKGDLSRSFEQSAQESMEIEVVESDVPQMIEEEQLHPEPHPPWDTRAIDAQIFNQRWLREIDANRGPDAFDKIDEQQMTLSQHFNTHNEVTETDTQRVDKENTRDEFDRIDIDTTLSDRFNIHAQSQERD